MVDKGEGRDVVVVDRNGSGGAVLLAVVVLAVLVVAVWFVAFGPGQGFLAGSTSGDGGVNVNIELPSIAPQAS